MTEDKNLEDVRKEEEGEFEKRFKKNLGWAIDHILNHLEEGNREKAEELVVQFAKGIHLATEEIILREIEEKIEREEKEWGIREDG